MILLCPSVNQIVLWKLNILANSPLKQKGPLLEEGGKVKIMGIFPLAIMGIEPGSYGA